MTTSDQRHPVRAVTQDRYGTAEVLRTTTVDAPVPGDHDVLVRVRAAGLDRGTEHLMTGRPYAVRLATGLRRPRNPVLGRDLAGTVEAVGRRVGRFAVGDEVFGVAPGALAELAVAREDKLARKPAGLGFAEAAVVPISAGTALQALEAGRVEQGQSVLVLGASGGVGSFAVQLAVAAGAEVTAVCSAAKSAFVRSLGAHHVVAYDEEDVAAGDRRFDLVLDIGGGTSVRALRALLEPRGAVVFVGDETGGSLTGMARQLRGLLLSPFVRQRLVVLVSKERGDVVERLADLAASGSFRPRIHDTVALDAVPEAMRLLEQGRVCGKLAVAVDPAELAEKAGEKQRASSP